MANETIKTDGDDQANEVDGVVSDAEALRRRAVSRANDDADGAHQGGMGAQGSAVDFGNPKNFGS